MHAMFGYPPFIAIFQMQSFCYIQLIMVSSTGNSDETSSSSSATGGSYSLISVAAAMCLMMSIAAAHLGAGIALLFEAQTKMTAYDCVQRMNIWRWVQRKMFGFMLLTSFVLLAAASIKVLFHSSSEDVDLVVGAATVLFIADVVSKDVGLRGYSRQTVQIRVKDVPKPISIYYKYSTSSTSPLKQ